jgi:hypothetical protein
MSMLRTSFLTLTVSFLYTAPFMLSSLPPSPMPTPNYTDLSFIPCLCHVLALEFFLRRVDNERVGMRTEISQNLLSLRASCVYIAHHAGSGQSNPDI